MLIGDFNALPEYRFSAFNGLREKIESAFDGFVFGGVEIRPIRTFIVRGDAMLITDIEIISSHCD